MYVDSGLNYNLGTCPRPGIEPATFRLRDDTPTNRDTLARATIGFLDGSILLAKWTGPENIIKCQYIQQLLWLEKKGRDELPGSEETEKLARGEVKLKNKV